MSLKSWTHFISPVLMSQACNCPMVTGWLVSTLSSNFMLERITSIGTPI